MYVCMYIYYIYTHTHTHTRAVQWETGKVVLKIACTADIIACRVCEGGDLELPIEGGLC